MLEPIFYTQKEDESKSYCKFIIEPLSSSLGQSVGNSLRRTLLSSLKGMAVSYVKIKNAPHLFTAIKGVKESALDITLNLKKLRFSSPTEGPHQVTLLVKGKGKVYGKDIDGDVEVINKDEYIAEITDDKSSLEIEAIVESGYGYVSSEEKARTETDFTPIDSAYSPIVRVNMKVEAARVGRKSDYDRLILEVWTDGSVTPEDSLREASQILSKNFSRLLSPEDVKQVKSEELKSEEEKGEINAKLYDIIIDELNLPSRVINALLREDIETVADLVKSGREKLVGLKGVGKKSIDLIDEELKKMGIELK